MSDGVKIPFGAKRVVGQSMPGDRYFEPATGRWRKLKPRWPIIGESEIIIRRCTVDQPELFDDMTIPTISVVSDDDTGKFTLYATSYGSAAPAGGRLLRKEPHPAPPIQFECDSETDALREAERLRKYLEWAMAGSSRAAAKREEGK